MARSKKIDIEDIFKHLESTIDKLEDESTSLQESLDAFEHGVGLTSQAQKTLLDAEQKVRLLLDAKGEAHSETFDQATSE